MISPVKLWRNQKETRELLGQTGKILAWTVIRVPPLGFESQAPYAVAVVDLGRNRTTGQLVDLPLDKIAIGQKVVAVIRRVRQPDIEGVIPYGIKFKPI